VKVDDVLEVGPLNRDGERVGRVEDESNLKFEIRPCLQTNPGSWVLS